MPYDTAVTELVEEHEYGTVDEALVHGVALWEAQRFFEAHECLEDVWHQAPEHDRAFWKGVIQVAVGCVHHQRENPEGAVTLWRRAADYLEPYPSVHHGVDVDQLREFALVSAAAVEAAGVIIDLTYPIFPAMDGGPWPGDEPDDGPFPLRDEPAWRQVPRGEQDAR